SLRKQPGGPDGLPPSFAPVSRVTLTCWEPRLKLSTLVSQWPDAWGELNGAARADRRRRWGDGGFVFANASSGRLRSMGGSVGRRRAEPGPAPSAPPHRAPPPHPVHKR